MKRYWGWGVALVAAVFAAWWIMVYISDFRYSRRDCEVEEVAGPAFTVLIPKGWRRPDYSNPRESKTGFSTSSSVREGEGACFVYGSMNIEDEGASVKVESVLADWRKDDGDGRLSKTKIGAIDAWTWTSRLSFVELVGEARTFVFRGANGHVYSAHYPLAARGGYRMRQDYVFGRILASMKFKQ